jgi:hypothetical protein
MTQRLPERLGELWRCAATALLLTSSGCFLVGYEQQSHAVQDSGEGPEGGSSFGDAAFDAADGEPTDGGRHDPDGGHRDLDSSAGDALVEAGHDAGHDAEAGPPSGDGGELEGGLDDAGELEGGAPLDGGTDAGAGTLDGGSNHELDAGMDAGAHDAGTDAGAHDASTGELDASLPDAGSHPEDAGNAGPDGGITDICEEQGSCNVNCSNDPYCSVGCSLLSTCSANCSGVDYCVARCESMATCNFNCREAGRCRATCAGILGGLPILGSTCTIDCRDAGTCDEIRCESGSKCLVRCAGAETCDFDFCHASQGPQSCASGVIVCGRPCP